jgi:hypothetical protein
VTVSGRNDHLASEKGCHVGNDSDDDWKDKNNKKSAAALQASLIDQRQSAVITRQSHAELTYMHFRTGEHSYYAAASYYTSHTD